MLVRQSNNLLPKASLQQSSPCFRSDEHELFQWLIPDLALHPSLEYVPIKLHVGVVGRCLEFVSDFFMLIHQIDSFTAITSDNTFSDKLSWKGIYNGLLPFAADLNCCFCRMALVAIREPKPVVNHTR